MGYDDAMPGATSSSERPPSTMEKAKGVAADLNKAREDSDQISTEFLTHLKESGRDVDQRLLEEFAAIDGGIDTGKEETVMAQIENMLDQFDGTGIHSETASEELGEGVQLTAKLQGLGYTPELWTEFLDTTAESGLPWRSFYETWDKSADKQMANRLKEAGDFHNLAAAFSGDRESYFQTAIKWLDQAGPRFLLERDHPEPKGTPYEFSEDFVYNPDLLKTPLPSYMDTDGDGNFDYNPVAGIGSKVSSASGTSDIPPVGDAPAPGGTSAAPDSSVPPVGGTKAPDDLDQNKGPETAALSMDQAREIFLGKIGDYVEWDSSKTIMTIAGMDKLATQVSRVNDFFGPDSTVMKTANPTEYTLHNKDKDYSWNETHRTWIESGKSDYDDRLKVFNGTSVSIEKKAAEAPAPEPAAVEPTAPPVVPPEAPVPEPTEPEGMPAPPVKPTEKEVREKADKIAQGKEFTQNLLTAEAEMAALEKQFDKVNKWDSKDKDHTDRYARELGELKKMRDAADKMLTALGGEFAELQENGVFPVDAPGTQLRIARMDAMNTSFTHINHVINHTLENDDDAVGERMHHRLTPREARDASLDKEWKEETMPRINGVVQKVDENMSVNGEADVDERGFKGNNKTLKLRYSTKNDKNEVTSVRRYDPEIKVRFRQVLPDDNYHEISTNLQVKYNGEYYQTIDDAVQKAAQDFKALIDGPTAEPEPKPEPVAPAEAPPKEEPRADDTADKDVDTTSAAPGTVEATRKQTQTILKDVALLPSTRVVDGRRVPLGSNESGFTAIIKSPSGAEHQYLQHVNADGYVDQRYVQLNGEGDWLAIPYSNFIEQEKAKDYEGIEADDPDQKDRQQYRPTDKAVWKNRHKGGRMTLTKRSE